MASNGSTPVVEAVHRSADHTFCKWREDEIELLAGFGVAGDAPAGARVKHRSRVKVDPSQPNLRQVHLIHTEIFERARSLGFEVAPGDMGENITTSGIDLIGLSVGTLLEIGDNAIISVTGLRNPCPQLKGIHPDFQGAMLDRWEDGTLKRLAGVMAVVVDGGLVKPGDPIAVTEPTRHRRLEKI